MVEANGTNIVKALAVTYLLSSNLLFDIGYVAHVFGGNHRVNLANDYVAVGTYNINNYLGNSTQTCSRTSVTKNYGGAVVKDTSKSPQIRHWCTGIGANIPNNANIGWRIRNVSPGATSFPSMSKLSVFFLLTLEQTQLGLINFYYVVFEATTISAMVGSANSLMLTVGVRRAMLLAVPAHPPQQPVQAVMLLNTEY